MKRILTIFIVLCLSSSVWAACTGTVKKSDYQNVSTSPTTFGATIFAIHDLVIMTGWCFNGTTVACTGPSMTLGAQSGVQVAGSGNPTQNDTGEPFIFYVLDAAASGSVNITWTVTGGTQVQVAYIDVQPSTAACYTFDKAAGRSAGTSGTANLPTITPTNTGSFVFVFTAVSGHVTNVNSPLACINFTGSGQTGDCSYDGSRNAHGWVVSSSGSVTNNMTMIHVTDDWEALAVSFSGSTGGTVTNPSHAIIM